MRRTAPIALCFLFVLGIPALLQARSRTGRVTFVTTTHAFFDGGVQEGLKVGDVLTLRRGAGGAKTCRIEAVSDHHGRCAGARLAPNATFALPKAAPHSVKVAREEVFADRAELASARDMFSHVTIAKVIYRDAGTGSGAAVSSSWRPLQGWARLGHAVWTRTGEAGTTRQQERLDLALGVQPLTSLPALGAASRLSVLWWSQQATQNRFRPGTSLQVYVWETDVTLRGPEPGLVFSAGRILPWFAPGVAFLDGAQAGWRFTSLPLEVGAFGGYLPDAMTLGLSRRRWAAGLYYGLDSAVGPATLVRNSGRVGLASSPETGLRYELENLTQLSHHDALQVSVSPRVGLTLGGRPQVSLDAVRADVAARPLAALTLAAGARWSSRTVSLLDDFGQTKDFIRSNSVANLGATYRLDPGLSVGASAYGAYDAATGDVRLSAGPEVGLPQLFGERGGLSAGYLIALGWAAGHTVYAQAVLAPAPGMRLWLRGTYYDEGQPQGRVRDVGLALRGDARIADPFTVSVALTAWSEPPLGRVVTTGAPAITASAALTGRL